MPRFEDANTGYEEFGLNGASLDQPRPKSKDYDEEYVPPYVPILSFDGLNLPAQLLEQLNAAKMMLHLAQYDKSVPLNQKAQTVNSITTILQGIAKTQTDIYNAERLKKLEGILIETLKEFPELKKAFMDRFDEVIAENDK